MTSKHGVSNHSNLFEVSRKNIIGKNKSLDPSRYNRRLNYRVTQAGSIDESRLINDDLIIAKVKVGDYICTVAFKNVIKNLINVIKSQPSPNVNLQSVIRAVNRAIDDSDILVDCTCPDFCLHEDTEIKLVNGEVITVKELKNRFDNGDDLWVYSVDEYGLYQSGKVTDVWISGYVNDLIKVTLDNYEEIITTPEHRYMLDDLSYEEARNLKPGYSVMSIITDSDLYYINMSEYRNRKVLSVEEINYSEPVPVYDITVDKYNNFYVSAGAVLHNCYRFAYWATRFGIKFGRPETRPSKITNPRDKLGATCKHLSAILANKRWLVKLSSVVNEVVKKHAPDIIKKYNLDPDEFIINVSGRPSTKTKRNLRMANRNAQNTSDNIDGDAENNDEELIPNSPFAIKGGTLDGTSDSE